MPWYITRGSGIAALILLLLLLLGGIGHVTGWTYRYIEPVRAWLIHKWLGIMLGIMVTVHAGVLLIDTYLPFSLADLLVPFAKSYDNNSTLFGVDLSILAIPSGIIALYIGGWIMLTSLTRLREKKTLWRYSHWLSYLLIPLILIHVAFSGTEFKSGALRWLFVGFVLLLIVAVVARAQRRAKKSPRAS